MQRCALLILDGWGLGNEDEHNAIYVAKTPNFDRFWQQHPNTKLEASGEHVGLPEGQIGGSEVGHLTIGAGRVIFQSLPRISKALKQADKQGGLLEEPAMQSLLESAKERSLHLIGLVSDGGVHSHIEHLYLLLKIFQEQGCHPPILHVITDGRDTSPQAARQALAELVAHLKNSGYGKIVTMCGRYYAMDRDQNWERTDKAVFAMVKGEAVDGGYELSGDWATDCLAVLEQSYANNLSDEFLLPAIVDPAYRGMITGEGVFFYNFRSDRMKQLVSQVAAQIGDEQVTTMMRYDRSYPYTFLFDKEKIEHTLGGYLSSLGLTQLRVTETEKAPHVTYFFNGGVEVTFDGEVRSIAQSNKVMHDQRPEMKAVEIEGRVADYVSEHHPDFILVNFANPDMVGHTGVFDAVVKGVEAVDNELGRLVGFLNNQGYVCVITADHGNAELMVDPQTGEVHTAHTLNKVPLVVVSPGLQDISLDQDSDAGLDRIAATICELMEIAVPAEFSASLILSD